MADVDVKIGATIDDLTSGIASAKSAVDGLASSFNQIAGLIGVAFTVDAIKDFIVSMEELGVQTERTAAMLGITVEQASTLNAISTLTGGSSDLLARAMERLAFNMQQAAAGGLRQQDAFRQLGISYKDANGQLLPLDTMLGKIADRFATAPDGPAKTAVAITLFSRAGAEMIPFLDRGAKGLKELGDAAQDTGVILDKATTTQLEAAHQKTVLMSDSVKGLGIVLMKEMIPSLNEANDWITKHIERLAAWERENQVLRSILQFLSQDIAPPSVRVRLLAEAAAFDVLKTSMSGVAAQMKTLTDDWADFDQKMTGGPAAQPKMTPILPPTDQKAANDALKQLMENVQSSMKVDNDFYEQQVSHIETAAKIFGFTEQEKTQMLISAVNARLATEIGGIDEALKHVAAGSNEYKKLTDMEVEARAQAEKQKSKFIDQELVEEQKQFQTVADDLAGAFNSQLRGILAGTTTWAQAMRNILGDMVIKMIEQFVKMGAEWAAQQAFMLVTQNTTQAAMAASQATAQTVGLPARIAAFGSTITADAAEVFAGVFANLAPALGPAAAAPAAASQAVVLAQLANVPKFDIGTNYVPQDMLAIVHQGEAITPAEFNPAAGGVPPSGGGIQFHFNGPVIGNQAWINSMIPQLSRALQSFQAVNPSAN
jgi:hypothetical protein